AECYFLRFPYIDVFITHCPVPVITLSAEQLLIG
ncbi:MAG: hypothetical protein Q609_ECAC02332G0001, partial [Escherichia coli DORA_A_5_14_21]